MGRRVREPVRDGVGTSVPRVEGVAKVSGAFAYGSDLWVHDMLFGAVLRSPHAHARIRGIDIAAALASPGVHAVLLADDVPGQPTFGLNYPDQPVLARDVVRYDGEPVALVAAETSELARRAVRRIAVDWEPLPVVGDMEDAMRPDAPQLHETGNVLRHVHLLHGDPDHAPADVWVQGYYETAMQDQAPLGPEAGLAIPAEDGGVDLYVVTQWIHVDRRQIAPCLGLPEDKVRITLAGVGGAFGSREDLHMQVHACMLALRTRRPVKMSFGREESFHAHVHRHPSRVWMRHGATRDGRLVAVDTRLVLDGGAYASSSPAVLGNAVTFTAGPYDVPNVRAEGTVVYTNNPPCGAMRGFGAPQVCFAHEAQMDKLAAALGIDPVELRLRNALQPGAVLPTGQVLGPSAPVAELIRRCRDLPLPAAEPELGRDPLQYPGGAGNVSRGEHLKRGVGFAVGYKNVAFSEGFDDSAEVRVSLMLGADGRAVAEVHTAAVDMGQGLYTLLTQIVRTELDVEHVVLHPADTAVGSAGSTSASRQTMMTGGAVQMACGLVRDELAARAEARGVTDDDVSALLDEPVSRTAVFHHRVTDPFDADGQGDIHVAFAFAAQRVVAEVDEELGLVRLVQVATAVDVGRAMNPASVEGQIDGGAAQGLGLALMEAVQLRDGVIANPSFTDYLIPTILDVPPMVSALVEEPEPGFAYGAKGIGESATVVASAAVAAALRDATGRELNRIPVTPDDLVGLSGPVTSGGRALVPPVRGQMPVPEYAGQASAQHTLAAESRPH